jgi:DNA polymerase-3 subunit epsilon
MVIVYGGIMNRLLYIDIESTGLSPREGHRIIEVAFKAMEGSAVVHSGSYVINPGRDNPAEAMAVNQMSNELIQSGIRFCEVAPLLKRIIESCNGVVGHNVRFDIDFLTNEFSMLGMQVAWPTPICTRLMAKASGRFENNKLQTLVAALGIQTTGAHRAMADVEACYQVHKQLDGTVS